MTIDGTVIATRVVNGEAVTKEVPVVQREPDMRKTLRLRVRVHLEPYDDVGYVPHPQAAFQGAFNQQFDFWDVNGNGMHDKGEPSEPYRDLSRFDPDPENTLLHPPIWAPGNEAPNNTGDGWGRVVTTQHVLDQIERANIAWAQAGIRVVMIDGPIIEEAPKDANGVDILHDGWVKIFEDPQDIIQSIGMSATEDIAEIIFSGPLSSNGTTHGAYGFGYIPRLAALLQQVPPDLRKNTYLFVGPSHPLYLRTLAHEIGHGLVNTDDDLFSFKPYVFFPADTTLPGGDSVPHRYRRVTQIVEELAHDERECLSCTGNTLLVP